MIWFPARVARGGGNARAVATTIGSYVTTIFPLARRELRRWERRGRAITDPELRRQAVSTLRAEHMNAEGAALFAILARPRWRPPLVRALVAYQTLYDYLDTLTEPPHPAHSANSAQLHHALVDALTPGGVARDWYRLHPGNEDGYIAGLVAACRRAIATLPAFSIVRDATMLSARRAIRIQTLNHRPTDDRHRDLRAWGERASVLDSALTCWEHAAGACSTLDLHTLLALAGDPATQVRDVRQAQGYGTALCGLNTMLESLIDLPADRRSGDHSYVAYYHSPAEAAERLGSLATTTVARAATLRIPERHLAIAQAMTSMYLSRPEARSAECRPAVETVVATIPSPLPELIGVQQLVRGLRPGAT